MPETMASSVLLPLPLGPTSARISPRATERSICSRTIREPNRLLTPRSSTAEFSVASSFTGLGILAPRGGARRRHRDSNIQHHADGSNHAHGDEANHDERPQLGEC